LRMRLSQPGTGLQSSGAEGFLDFTGKFVELAAAPGLAEYHMTYLPVAPGNFNLHLFQDKENGERIVFPESPYSLSILADQVGGHDLATAIDASGITPKDYKVSRKVFEEVQRKWGECTIDAFASPATALCPRFWTATQMSGSEAIDAFEQSWQQGEVVWAHPPSDLLPQLVKMLEKSSRLAEVIVCTPFRPKADWSFDLSRLADDEMKLNGGHLAKVAADAPDRVNEWPIVLYHIPAPAPYDETKTPLARIPESVKCDHKKPKWSPGWFTSGTWQAAVGARKGIQRATRQLRSFTRLVTYIVRWLRRARQRLASVPSKQEREVSEEGDDEFVSVS